MTNTVLKTQQLFGTGTSLGTKTAITANFLTSGVGNSTASSYATASVTPTANRLVLFVVSHIAASAAEPTDIAGAGLTFTKIASGPMEATWGSSSLWYACAASPTTGAITVTFAANHDGCRWSVCEFACDASPSDNGKGAILQIGIEAFNGITPLTTHIANSSRALDDDNAMVLVNCRNQAAAVSQTPGTGLTELSDTTGTLTADGRFFHMAWNFSAIALDDSRFTNNNSGTYGGSYFLELKAAASIASQNITGVKFTNTSTFGTSVTTRGVRNITGVKFTNTSTFGTNVVTRGVANITGVKFTNVSTFSVSVVGRGTVTISGVKFSDPDSFGTSVTTRGVRNITGVKYTDPDTFGTAVVGRGAVNITGARYVNTNTFGTAALTQGPATIAAVKVVNVNTFGTAVVSRGSVSISGVKYGNLNTFGTAVVGRGTITISGSKFTDGDAFGNATIGQVWRITGVRFTNVSTFGSAKLTYGVSGSKFTNISTFGTSILQSNQAITSVRYNNISIFGNNVVGRATWSINAVKVANNNSFGVANVSTGAVGILGHLFIDGDGFGTHQIYDPLTGPGGGGGTPVPNIYELMSGRRGRRG